VPAASRLEPVECAAFTQPKLITDTDASSAISSRGGDDDDASGYLASYYAQTLGHGRPDCPWTIAVRPGNAAFPSNAIYTSLFAMKGSSRNKTEKSLTNYSMRTVTVRIFTHFHILTV